ncbi:MAG: hypothetical protein AAF368_13225, partial [Planctomycetota bacterium]
MSEELRHGPCGCQEDPPEDLFAASVMTSSGVFRHVEGVWESATFYLQRVVDLLRSVPTEGDWKLLHRATEALLRLSEEVCRRSGHDRYEFADEAGDGVGVSAELIAELQRRVLFTENELRELRVEAEDLDVFVFRPGLARVFDRIGLQHSPLLYHPVLKFEECYVLALPTAVSVAIRQFIIGGLVGVDRREAVVSLLAAGYADLFRSTPPLGVGNEPPILFRDEGESSVAEYGGEFEPGRYAHFVFWLDGLGRFVEEGLSGDPPVDSLVERTKEAVEAFRRHATESGAARGGVTFLVVCGVGRGFGPVALVADDLSTESWPVVCISAPDLETLTLLEKRLPTVLAVEVSQRLLHERGVRLVNLSGPLNLLALAESHEGHLVPHGHFDEAIQTPIDVMLPTDALLELRRQRW